MQSLVIRYIVLIISVLLIVLFIYRPVNYDIKKYIPKTRNILVWNNYFNRPDYYFGLGFDGFKQKCSMDSCFLTNDRKLKPIDEFDAIVFHGPQYHPKANDFPSKRSSEQIYVYFAKEAPTYKPLDLSISKNFFNLTATYRLDSDIVVSYFRIKDADGNTIAPNFQPDWMDPVLEDNILNTYVEIHKKKNKAAAWFVSHCKTSGKREEKVKDLGKYIDVDIYGKCGKLKCPHEKDEECFDRLRSDYFFYLSFENSRCVDYVTEKILNAIKNDVIPVVLNGADMNRFLPPGSYINALDMSTEELAQRMKRLISDPLEFAKYFWWKSFYNVAPVVPNLFCQLCEMLNDETYPKKTYPNLIEWWQGEKPGRLYCNTGK